MALAQLAAPRSARAPPREASSRRIRFEIATRLRPTRRPTSSLVSPRSSTSIAQARASSTGFRSSRAMFSAARGRAAPSPRSGGPPPGSARARRAARRAAGARRRRARSAPPGQRPHDDRLEHAARADRLGELGERLARRSSAAAGAGSGRSGRAGSRAGPSSSLAPRGRIAARPRPMPAGLGIVRRQVRSIRLATALSHVRRPPSRARGTRREPALCGCVLDDRDAVARRLAEPDVARDDGVEDELREVLAHLALDVLRQPRAPVVHRQDHPRDREPRVELALDQARACRAGRPDPRARSTRSAPGRSRWSAATSALTVSGPSDGGQSSSVNR